MHNKQHDLFASSFMNNMPQFNTTFDDTFNNSGYGMPMENNSMTKITSTDNMKLGDPNNMVDTRNNPMVQSQQAITNSGQGFLSEASMQNVASTELTPVKDMNLTTFTGDRDFTEPKDYSAYGGTTEEFASSLPGPKDPLAKSDGMFSNLTDKLGTALNFSPLLGAVAGYQQTRSNIDSLRGARSNIQSVIKGLAGERDASFDALAQEYSEGRRRTGERLKMNIMGALDKLSNVRTGNLVSGTQMQKKDEIVDTAQTQFDIREAELFDRYQEDQSRALDQNRNERMQMNTQLDQINKQIADQRKELITGPIGSIVDVGTNLLMASNPALAVGLQVGKTLLG